MIIFASISSLLSGALIGLIFGALLQLSGVAKFDTIVGQLTLRDFTVLKVIMSAIIVGSIGVYTLLEMGAIDALLLKALPSTGIIVGGIIFGIGMAILGYCPGTCVASAGQGSIDAMYGIAGMVFGSMVYAYSYEWISKAINAIDLTSHVTLDALLNVPATYIVASVAIGGIAFFAFLEYIDA